MLVRPWGRGGERGPVLGGRVLFWEVSGRRLLAAGSLCGLRRGEVDGEAGGQSSKGFASSDCRNHTSIRGSGLECEKVRNLGGDVVMSFWNVHRWSGGRPGSVQRPRGQTQGGWNPSLTTYGGGGHCGSASSSRECG